MIPSAEPNGKSRVGTLQILRMLAATLVMVGHLQHEMLELMGTKLAPVLHEIPFDWGLGVDIFFVISGFIMYYLCHDKFGQKGSAGLFLRRRLARIVPLYWFFTTIILVIALMTTRETGGLPLKLPNIVASYLFIPGPVCLEFCYPVYTLGWTLNFEMLFYVLFAVALMMRRTPGLIFIAAMLLAFMGLRLLTIPLPASIHFWGDSISGDFLAGIVISRLYMNGVRIRPSVAVMMIALAGIVAVIFYQAGLYRSVGRIVTGGIPATLIVMAGVLAWQAPGRSLVSRILIHGGDASYALYLWHPFAVKATSTMASRIAVIADTPALFMVIAIIIAYLGASVIHIFFERPLTHWFNRRAVRGASSRRWDAGSAAS